MQRFLAEKVQKCFSGRGSSTDPRGGAYSAPRPLAGFRERKGKAVLWEGWKEVKGKGKGGDGPQEI